VPALLGVGDDLIKRQQRKRTTVDAGAQTNL
jgi:hypothetical protein